MKDPETLDSLLESKEQTDKALAELADSYREKLRKLEAVISPTSQTKPSQSKVSETFELRIGKQFWTWFWRVIAFVVMSVLIWGVMALLKEPKANGKATAPVSLEIVAEHPVEPNVSHTTVIPSMVDDEPVSPDVLPSQPTEGVEDNPSVIETMPVTTQRQRIKLFQRRP